MLGFCDKATVADEHATEAMTARHDKLKQGRGNMGLDSASSDVESKARLWPGELGHKHTQRFLGKHTGDIHRRRRTGSTQWSRTRSELELGERVAGEKSRGCAAARRAGVNRERGAGI
jgi:hypothetical protein